MPSVQLNLFSRAVSYIEEKIRALGAPHTRARMPSAVKRIRTFPDAPELKRIWTSLQYEYFPREPEIGLYTVCWSRRRQLRTLASCNSSRRRVNVARELNRPDCEKWLPPLLYHEMCHAVLANHAKASGCDISFHGREFKQLEKRHPMMREFNRWIRSGGWLHVVRSDRAKEAHARRKSQQKAA